jgi:hypothetical protein
MLMDRPAGGWGEVVTNASIRPTVEAIDRRFELRREMDRGFRDQTWRLMTAIFASTGTMAVAIVAAVRR